MSAPRVVITHDFMETYGGAERVTAEMAAAFPDAPVVALLGRPSVARRMGVADRFRTLVPARERLLRRYRYATPAWGAFADHVRLPEADVVLASSYAYAHRLKPPGGAPTVCYCHGPMRFAWSMTDAYRQTWGTSGLRRRAFDALAAFARADDRRASARVTQYLTQSPYTARQITAFYGRKAEIVGVPFDAELFRPPPPGTPIDDAYLLVSRLIEPYKRVGIVIEAFRAMPDQRLVVVGDGPAGAELRASAPPNVTFLGTLEDDPLIHLMQRCRAAICPSREDFGLVPVEVMACGRPVLAYAGGGALHTVELGISGDFFLAQTPESLVAAVRAFDPDSYDPEAVRGSALRWDRTAFQRHLVDAVTRAVQPA